MSNKWYKQVNQYVYPIPYLAVAELHSNQLQEDANWKYGRTLMDSCWLWLHNHHSISPKEIYKQYQTEITASEISEVIQNGGRVADIDQSNCHGSMPDWMMEASTEEQQAIWGMANTATLAVIYCVYDEYISTKEMLATPGDVAEASADSTDEYWNQGFRDYYSKWFALPKWFSLLQSWLAENYPPGTEDKPVDKEEIMALIEAWETE